MKMNPFLDHLRDFLAALFIGLLGAFYMWLFAVLQGGGN